MDWTFVLVIILSVFLALFLLLGIVLVILLIKVTLQIRDVTKSAKNTAGTIESMVTNVSKFSSPLLISKVLLKHAKKLKNIKKK